MNSETIIKLVVICILLGVYGFFIDEDKLKKNDKVIDLKQKKEGRHWWYYMDAEEKLLFLMFFPFSAFLVLTGLFSFGEFYTVTLPFFSILGLLVFFIGCYPFIRRAKKTKMKKEIIK